MMRMTAVLAKSQFKNLYHIYVTRYDFLDGTGVFEQCSNRLQLDMITLLVIISYQVGLIMTTRYNMTT